MLKKAAFCAIVLGFLCASAYAQFWPLPNYTTPNSPTVCTNCLESAQGMPTPGWSDPVVRYVGRFVSSEYVADFQQYYRTVRAGGVHMTPDGSRIGIKLGNGVATYDTATFLSRLDAHEPMVSVSTIPTNPITTSGNRFGGPTEIFLNFDRFFYPEWTSSGWSINLADGQDRLSDFDMDDRGLIYMAYGMFAWGVASDTGASSGRLMPSWQDKNSFKNWAPASTAFWVKDGADYYALAQNSADKTITHLFKVPAYNNVTEITSLPYAVKLVSRGSNNRTAVVNTTSTNVVSIYDNHALVTGGQPMQQFSYDGSSISLIAYDGTNFWTAGYGTTGCLLSKISPNGTGYTRTLYQTNYGGPYSLKINGGYLVTVTGDVTGKNAHLYNISNGTPVEIPIPSISNYFKNQSGFAPVPVTHMSLWSADPLVYGGKLYLIVNADGIGDVYQIRTADTVTVSSLGTAGPFNSNAPAKATGDIFYGDTVNFSAALSSGALGGALSWNFGAIHDPANTAPGTFGTAIPHQYTGLTAADIASPLNVTATNSANGVVGNLPITLKQGTVRLKYGNATGAKNLVTLPGTDARIVMDDLFYDASDGDTAGHYTEWRIGADLATITTPSFLPQYLGPATGVAVGACGQHTLSMTAHYGYSAPATSNVDFPVSLGSPFTYTVSSFAPGVDVSFNSTTGNEEFFSTSRAAATLAGRTFSYTWDVVDSNGTAVATIAPQTGTTTSIDTIPRYLVSKALFAQAGYQGRLTLGVSGVDPCSQVGGTIPSAQAKSSALVPPDAALNTSCTNGTCQYSITSPSNSMTKDAWTFAWSANGGSPSTGTTSALTVNYYTVGDFVLNVTVTNKTGLIKQLSYTAHITTPASQCPAFTPSSNVGITFAGTNSNSNCVDGGSSTCIAGEPIQFQLAFFPIPQQSCLDSINYAWRVDGGAVQNGSTVTTSFATTGQHTVTMTLTTGTQSVPLTRTITIGTSAPPPPPPPPPPPTSNCATLNGQNTFLNYQGTSPTCQNGGSCTASENITFSISYWNYNNACGNHSYRWSVDSGAGSLGSQDFVHAFTTSGQHTVSCTVSNGSSNYTINLTINITGGTTPPTPTTGACGTMTANSNVSLEYSGTTAGCRTGGTCTGGEQITMSIAFWGYDKSCATHTYNWKVDGASIGTGETATTTLTAGNHTLTCTLSNGSQSIDLTRTVTVTGSIPVTPTYTFNFGAMALTIPANSYAFELVTDPPTIASQTQWVWNFGDNSGEVTGGPVQTHTYQNNNDYTISVHAVGSTTPPVSHKLSDLLQPARRRGVRH